LALAEVDLSRDLVAVVPEARAPRIHRGELAEFGEGEGLPDCSEKRRNEERRGIEAEEAAEQARVAEIDLGRFHDSLVEAAEPGFEEGRLSRLSGSGEHYRRKPRACGNESIGEETWKEQMQIMTCQVVIVRISINLLYSNEYYLGPILCRTDALCLAQASLAKRGRWTSAFLERD